MMPAEEPSELDLAIAHFNEVCDRVLGRIESMNAFLREEKAKLEREADERAVARAS